MRIGNLARMMAVAAALAAVCSAGCKGKAPTVRVVMENQTGQHMTNFSLDYGAGKIEYEIFSRDYTFAEEAVLPASPTPLTVGFNDDSGARITYQLERPISPDMAGGDLRITFLPEGKHTMKVDWP